MSAIDETLKKLVLGKNLHFDETVDVMEEVVTGDFSHLRFAAWLTALRVKGETPEEIAASASVMRKYATKVVCKDPKMVDIVGTGGDGCMSMNVSTAAAFVAAGAGVTIAKHGSTAVSSRSGSADVLTALGINVSHSAKKTEECLEKIGISFMFAPVYHSVMKHAASVRKELGMRTIFNILGPLANPAGARRYVMGVYSDKLCRPMAKAAIRLGYERLLVVHGSDGLDEITVAGPSYVCEVRDESVLEYKISPEEFGISLAGIDEVRGGTPEENAAIIRDILSGRIKGAKRDIVLLNAAAAIMVADQADGWIEALKKASDSIDSGSAQTKLHKFIELSAAFTLCP